MLPPVRASARSRERALRSLGAAYRNGLLSTGTFELRVERALWVNSDGQLRELLGDLPGTARMRLWMAGVVRRRFALSPSVVEAAAINLVLPRNDRLKMTIGRHPDCDIVFTDATVSRLHASLRRRPQGWTICDLGSSNGTWLNGRRIGVSPVEAGDELIIGRLKTRLV